MANRIAKTSALRTACNSCRDLKVRCNGQLPCDNCAKAGSVCGYSLKNRLGRPKGSRNTYYQRIQPANPEPAEPPAAPAPAAPAPAQHNVPKHSSSSPWDQSITWDFLVRNETNRNTSSLPAANLEQHSRALGAHVNGDDSMANTSSYAPPVDDQLQFDLDMNLEGHDYSSRPQQCLPSHAPQPATSQEQQLQMIPPTPPMHAPLLGSPITWSGKMHSQADNILPDLSVLTTIGRDRVGAHQGRSGNSTASTSTTTTTTETTTPKTPSRCNCVESMAALFFSLRSSDSPIEFNDRLAFDLVFNNVEEAVAHCAAMANCGRCSGTSDDRDGDSEVLVLATMCVRCVLSQLQSMAPLAGDHGRQDAQQERYLQLHENTSIQLGDIELGGNDKAVVLQVLHQLATCKIKAVISSLRQVGFRKRQKLEESPVPSSSQQQATRTLNYAEQMLDALNVSGSTGS